MAIFLFSRDCYAYTVWNSAQLIVYAWKQKLENCVDNFQLLITRWGAGDADDGSSGILGRKKEKNQLFVTINYVGKSLTDLNSELDWTRQILANCQLNTHTWVSWAERETRLMIRRMSKENDGTFSFKIHIIWHTNHRPFLFALADDFVHQIQWEKRVIKKKILLWFKNLECSRLIQNIIYISFFSSFLKV